MKSLIGPAVLCVVLASQASVAFSQNAVDGDAFPAVSTTWTGQPIVLPQGPVEVRGLRVDIPAGGRLPPHKHPFPRYAFLVEGRLKVINEVTGESRVFEAGAFVVEALA